MQVYYSQYLPGLLYSLLAPVYLFFRLRGDFPHSGGIAFCRFDFVAACQQYFPPSYRKAENRILGLHGRSDGYYLESVQGLTTFKLFGRDEGRQNVLSEKSRDFNNKIMDVMRVNFSSFLLTDGLIYGAVVVSTVIAAWQLFAGQIAFSDGLMVLMLSFGFFGSVRQLMNATHSALAGVSAADKVEKLLAIDTARPYRPELPARISLMPAFAWSIFPSVIGAGERP